MNEEENVLNEMKKAYAIRDSELKSKFKTMLFIYRNALSMLSGLKNELDEVVSHIDNLEIETISSFYKPLLEKANDLVSKIEDLDGEMKNHSDMEAYLSSIKTQLKSHNINIWVKKLDEVKYQIIKAKEAEERRKQEEALKKLQRQEIITIDGLMYQNQPFTKQYNWEDANKYAKNLRLGGYDDWRLPTIDELKKLLTLSKNKNSKGQEYSIRKEFVESFTWFWSITEYNNSSFDPWGVSFSSGSGHWGNLSYEYCALCVRGQ